MNSRSKILPFLLLFLFTSICHGQNNNANQSADQSEKSIKKSKKKKFKLPKIDLNHWSVTTPAVNEKNGKATNIEPPEILNYATDERLLPYMYNDSTSGALVFYAFPSEATTANTKYSRSELREQMVPGDNNKNWTFKDGGLMVGDLSIEDVSKAADGKYHRVIIMQIHGRLTNEQRDLIGQKDNNAPPILKIYWQDGKIRIKTKVLKNLDANETEILHDDAWDDDEGFNFEQKVDFSRFLLKVKVSEGKMVISLNDNEFKVYEGIHMEKWGVFENYFKAGNYFQSRDEGSFAKVKYYSLKVEH
uniref:polysaccharide lyase family 7 protein n=1 Tax=Flavobacterium sp. TaxID=239 RepID=UPI00404B22C0